jgi:hypothetical protein
VNLVLDLVPVSAHLRASHRISSGSVKPGSRSVNLVVLHALLAVD